MHCKDEKPSRDFFTAGYFATGSKDGTIILYHADSGKAVQLLAYQNKVIINGASQDVLMGQTKCKENKRKDSLLELSFSPNNGFLLIRGSRSLVCLIHSLIIQRSSTFSEG